MESSGCVHIHRHIHKMRRCTYPEQRNSHVSSRQRWDTSNVDINSITGAVPGSHRRAVHASRGQSSSESNRSSTLTGRCGAARLGLRACWPLRRPGEAGIICHELPFRAEGERMWLPLVGTDGRRSASLPSLSSSDSETATVGGAAVGGASGSALVVRGADMGCPRGASLAGVKGTAAASAPGTSCSDCDSASTLASTAASHCPFCSSIFATICCFSSSACARNPRSSSEIPSLNSCVKCATRRCSSASSARFTLCSSFRAVLRFSSVLRISCWRALTISCTCRTRRSSNTAVLSSCASRPAGSLLRAEGVVGISRLLSKSRTKLAPPSLPPA
mmetsp:Transcript_17652/g.44492  ORF Transcript_17652/g.44492 Transcript_17652/m.44492 type:complete len:333 (+) Transcript_17652:16-1014(+)